MEGPQITGEEREDLTSLLETYLGDYADDYRDAHGFVEWKASGAPIPQLNNFDEGEAEGLIAYYDRLGRLYYAFSGRDFHGPHGFISNYSGRKENAPI